ncbi:MAG: alpha/beta fold hydrolase [Bradyrhizobium sp.]
MSEAQHSFAEVAGCKISLHRAGKGEPLLFLHGARGASEWTPFMAALAERFDVIVPEHPGFGRSQTPDWLDNVGDLAYFYLDFLEKNRLDGVHLVGTSLGGWVAAEMAVRQTAALKSLTLVAPAGIHVPGVPKGDIFLWSAETTTRNLFFDPALAEVMLAQPVSEEQQDRLLQNNLTMAKLSWQPRLYNPDLAKWLHRIDVPTLIVWGEQDKVIPAAYGPAFERLIPGAQLKILPACGHLPHVERTSAFVKAIVDFTSEVV